jgi:spore maturation protein SpmB
MIANGIFPNLPLVMVGFAVFSASGALYAALLTEVMTANIVNAVIGKDLEHQTSLLSSVIGKAVYNVLKDEKKKD